MTQHGISVPRYAGAEPPPPPYPWTTNVMRARAVEYCDMLSSELVEALSVVMSERHRMQLTTRSWRILLRPTISFITMTAYYHYTCLMDAKDVGEVTEVVSLGAETLNVPLTAEELQTYMWKDEIHSYFIQEIAAQICVATLPTAKVNFANKEHPADVRLLSNAGYAIRRALVASVKTILRWLSGMATCHLYNVHFTPREALTLIFGSLFRIGLLPNASLTRVSWPSADLDWRTRVEAILQASVRRDNKFEKCLCRLIAKTMPISLAEGLPELQKFVAASFPPRPKVIVSGMAWLTDDAFKLWCATASDAGTRLVSAQHGAVYGVRQCAALSERIEYDISDSFLSWGGSAANLEKTTNLPVLPHLFSVRPVDERGYLLICGTTEARLPTQISSAPVGGLMLDYISRQARLLAALPEVIRPHCLVRPNPDDWIWSVRNRIEILVPWVQFDEFDRNLIERFGETRLAVIDNLNSTFLQSMGSGIPTILTWDPEVFALRDEAAPFFEKLEAAGVYFRSPEEAAKKVGKIWNDPLGWWRSAEVVRAVEPFLARYFRKDVNWAKLWRDAILANIPTK